MIIDRVEVGDKTQNTLLLLHLDLPPGYLFGRENGVHRGYGCCNRKPDSRQFHVLARPHDDFGRGPVCESTGANGDTVGYSRLEMVE